MDDKSEGKEEPIKSKTEQELAREFIDEYQKLCERYQMQVIVQPTFLARDDGTFSVKLISSVGKLPKKE